MFLRLLLNQDLRMKCNYDKFFIQDIYIVGEQAE